MQFKDQWEGDGFAVGVYISDALLYMKMTGVVGLQSYYQGAAYAAGVGSQRPYAAILIDLRRALLVSGEGELLSFKPPKSALATRWRPGAFLVQLELEPLFKKLAWKLAHEGYERAVFTSGSSALAWARQAAARARVRAALQVSKSLALERDPPPLAFAPSAPGAL